MNAGKIKAIGIKSKSGGNPIVKNMENHVATQPFFACYSLLNCYNDKPEMEIKD